MGSANQTNAVKTDQETKKAIMQNHEKERKERKKQEVKQSYKGRQMGKKQRQQAYAGKERLQA